MAGADSKRSGRAARLAVRVNVGGSSYEDRQGRIWHQDVAYHKGAWGCLNLPETDTMRTTHLIEGTKDPTLFQTVRMGEEVRYRFDLPNGAYRVRILLAEIYWESSDAEQQDVYVQGRKVLGEFNIFDEAGHDAAIVKDFKTKVADGHLEVRFVGRSLPMHSGARACGIEVEPAPTG